MPDPNTEPAVKRPQDSQSVGMRGLETWLDRYFYLILTVILIIIICFCAAGIFIDRKTLSLFHIAFAPEMPMLAKPFLGSGATLGQIGDIARCCVALLVNR